MICGICTFENKFGKTNCDMCGNGIVAESKAGHQNQTPFSIDDFIRDCSFHPSETVDVDMTVNTRLGKSFKCILQSKGVDIKRKIDAFAFDTNVNGNYENEHENQINNRVNHRKANNNHDLSSNKNSFSREHSSNLEFGPAIYTESLANAGKAGGERLQTGLDNSISLSMLSIDNNINGGSSLEVGPVQRALIEQIQVSDREQLADSGGSRVNQRSGTRSANYCAMFFTELGYFI